MPQQFTNRAQLSYNDTVVVSNTVVGEIADVLSVTKTALPETYSAGQRVTYIVNLVNSGATALTDLTLTDDFGQGTAAAAPLTFADDGVRYFLNGVPQPDPTMGGSGPRSVTGLTVPAGGNATLVYGATVNGYASPEAGATVVNTVTVSGAGIADVTATATISAVEGPVLSITKSLAPVSVPENGTLTYTFLIQNTGNAAATAADELVLTDTFAPILSGLTVTCNGAPMAQDTYTYAEDTGAFATVAGAIEVPAATFTQTADGAWVTTPGTATLTVTGTV